MLSDSTLDEASILARDFSARGIILKVNSDSPLFTLCCDSTPVDKIYPSFNEIIYDIKKASGAVGLDGKMEHRIDLQSIASVLSQSLSTAINVARNVVNPFVKHIVSEIDRRVNDTLYYNTGITIKTVFKPKILTGGKLDELTQKYKGSTFRQHAGAQNGWPSMSAEDLKRTVTDAYHGAKSDTDDLIANTTDERLVDYYNELFVDGLSDEYDVDEKKFIFGFLWASYWLANPNNTVNMDLKTYRLFLTEIKANCAKQIQNALTRYETMSTQKNFVLEVPSDKDVVKQMVVQGEIYNDWLTTGGSPELLIGAWLANKITHFGTIDETTRSRWLRRYKLDSDLRRQHYEARVQTIMSKILSDGVDEKIAQEKLNRKEIRGRFNNLMKQKPFLANGNRYKWVRMIVCKCFYTNNDVLKILTKMDEVLETHETMPPREAATVVCVDLIIDWLLSAVSVGYKTSM